MTLLNSPGLNISQEKLTVIEQTELTQHEEIIERGLKTFVDVGSALMAIRDKRLYRQTHGTFEKYCLDRWGMEVSGVYRYIEAAQVVSNIDVDRDQHRLLPSSIRQATPLASLSPDDQRTAWQEVVDTAQDGKITGALVAAVAEKYKTDPEPTPEPRTVDMFTGEILGDDDLPESVPEPEPPAVNRAYKNSSESNEWYTPSHLIQKATSLLGVINLDPASSEFANQTVQARHYFTIDDDGLTRQWVGNVWCNPPYGDAVGPFVEKMAAEYEAGRITEGLLLVAARTDTQWFRKLRNYPRCFLWGRVKFIDSETGASGDPAGFPSMIVYFGSRPDSFAETFKDIGDIYALWGTA